MDKNAYGQSKKPDESFRRNWDNSTYERRAQDREHRIRMEEEDEERRHKGLKPRIRESGSKRESRELLQAHKGAINLEGMVGKVQVVQASSAASGQPGFYCKVCDVTVKDSMSYLDHINGKNHQRMLNRSMKVATETVGDVLRKLGELRKAKQRQNMDNADYNFYEQVKRQQQIDHKKRLKRKEARKRYRTSHAEPEATDSNADNFAGGEDADDIGLILGISSFGSTKR